MDTIQMARDSGEDAMSIAWRFEISRRTVWGHFREYRFPQVPRGGALGLLHEIEHFPGLSALSLQQPDDSGLSQR